ncbi:hypothetical protein M8C21_013844 [Ambrosia artemisiifolia]|uniref:MBD domain-containing protein n=1 Tax=Ambrosia artemisiifolia TaxID=4212 RepID=A0AAD5CM00_AMBAR|nr:hypothetical protein M8C21_013844 [Ambrosia artemisiifolia]
MFCLNVGCYIGPDGHKCYSKPQLFEYLKRTNKSIPDDKTEDADGQGIDLSVEPNAFHTDEVPGSSPGGHPTKLTPRTNRRKSITAQEKPATEPDSSQYEDTEVEKKTEKKTKSSRLSSGYEVISRTAAEGLPPDWIKEVRMKKSGSTPRKDTYYLDPLSEYAFCSKKDVLRYLESGDIKSCASRPLKSHTNNGETLNVNMTPTGGEMPPQSDQSKGTEASKEFTNGSVEKLKTNESGIENPEPLRSVTGGSFSTPDRRLFLARKEDADWLPDGWLIDVRYKSSGMKYKIYKDPATGKQFYSKPQVLSFLENGSISNPRKRKAHDSSVAPDSSPNTTPADVSGPKRSRKKKDKSENAEYQEVITTSAAKAADNTNHRATNNNSPATDSPARSSKRQETGVNLEKEPDDDGNLPFDMPEDDNWTDQYFEVKSLANEIMFNGQPISGGFQEDNAAGVETTGVKDTTPTKVE